MACVLDRIAELVEGRRTTLVFVNTRRMAERLAHQLGERLGEDVVAAHHGSLSRERRHRVESRLRAGDLRALVATASLELGIDVGPVELVCQIGSPRSIATFLQRGGALQPHPGRNPDRKAVPPHPRRAGRVHRVAGGSSWGATRRGRPSGRPARHPRSAGGRRDRHRAVAHVRPLRPGSSGTPLP
ncbi:MAG: helicase-related protein [Microthrixaceae bacterium]|nr:helicase-related protein [Microthrixaceae bacterium]